MAGKGPLPRSRSVVVIPRNARAKKPPALPNAATYSSAVRDWYATWIKTPQASIFTASEWQSLQMLAPVVEAFYAKPSASLHAEIRLSSAKLGATREDRVRLGWLIEGESDVLPDPAEPTTPTSSRDRPDPRRNPRP